MEYRPRKAIPQENWKYWMPYEQYRKVYNVLHTTIRPEFRECVFIDILDNGFEWALGLTNSYIKESVDKIHAGKRIDFKYTGPRHELYARDMLFAVKDIAHILEKSENLIDYILISKELRAATKPKELKADTNQ